MSLDATRDVARRIGAHVMARARYRAVGRIDLCPTPGGFGTPAFGADHCVIRVSGGLLVLESTGSSATTRSIAIDGSSLAELAVFAGVDLDGHFDVGHDTPVVGDVNARLSFDGGFANALGDWWGLGLRAIDAAIAELPASSAPGRARIWPEHFDLGVDVAAADGTRLNLGASAGDHFSDDCYLYVAPWGTQRPGDESFWNAPFGAALSRSQVAGATDATAFFGAGLARFS